MFDLLVAVLIATDRLHDLGRCRGGVVGGRSWTR